MRQAVENLLDDRDRCADFVETDPDARVDVAVRRGAEVEGEVVIGRVAAILFDRSTVAIPDPASCDVPIPADVMHMGGLT
jgi:hypothetical protein